MTVTALGSGARSGSSWTAAAKVGAGWWRWRRRSQTRGPVAGIAAAKGMVTQPPGTAIRVGRVRVSSCGAAVGEAEAVVGSGGGVDGLGSAEPGVGGVWVGGVWGVEPSSSGPPGGSAGGLVGGVLVG